MYKRIKSKSKTYIIQANLPEFKVETLEILEQLKTIDSNVVFNLVIDDTKFHFDSNMDFESFYNFINSTERKWMDTFPFMDLENNNL